MIAGISSKWHPIYPHVVEFLAEQGRMVMHPLLAYACCSSGKS